MDDLISRKTAIHALGEKPIVWDDLSDFELGKVTQWADDVEAIKNLPSVQRTGTWEHKNVSSEGVDEWQAAQCSVCGLWHTTPYAYYYEHYKYCPNCGARMESK